MIRVRNQVFMFGVLSVVGGNSLNAQAQPFLEPETSFPHAIASDSGQGPDQGLMPLSEVHRQLLDLFARLVSLDPVERQGAIGQITAGQVYIEPTLRDLVVTDIDLNVRIKALEKISQLDWPQTAEALTRRIDFIAQWLNHEMPELARTAAACLGGYAMPESSRYLRSGLSQLPSPRQAERKEALEALSHADAFTKLRQWFTKQPEGGSSTESVLENVLVRAAMQLTSAPNAPESLEALTTLGTHRGAEVAWRSLFQLAARRGGDITQLLALRLLTKTLRPEDLSIMLDLVKSPRAIVRSQAAEALATFDTLSVTKVLVELVDKDASEQVQKNAANALRQHRSSSLIPALLPILRQPESYARVLANFLVRERDDDAALWARVVGLASSPDETERSVLKGTPAEQRRRVLLPRLFDEAFSRLPLPEKRVLCDVLSDVVNQDEARDLITRINGELAAEALDLFVPLLERHPSSLTLAALQTWLDREDNHDSPHRLSLMRLTVKMAEAERRPVIVAALNKERDPDILVFLLEVASHDAAPEVQAQVWKHLTSAETRVVGAALNAAEPGPSPILSQELFRVFERSDLATHIEQAQNTMQDIPIESSREYLRRLSAHQDTQVKLWAIKTLGEHGDTQDTAFLLKLSEEDDEAVRIVAKNALHSIDPKEFPAWDTNGRWPLIVASAGLGSSMFAMTTKAAGADDRIALLAVGGGVLGASTSFLLTLDSDVSLGEAGYFSTLGLWSTAGGYGIAKVAGLGERYGPQASLWAAVAAQAVGATVGGLTLKAARWEAGDVILTNTVAASWGVGLLGAAVMFDLDEDPESTAHPLDVFSAGAFIASLPLYALSSRIKLSSGDKAGIAATAGMGALVGAFAGPALKKNSDAMDVVGGVALGQAVGLTTGLTIGALSDFDAETMGWVTTGLITGGLGGWGLGKSLKLNNQQSYALLQAEGLAAAVALGWLGPKLDLSGSDVGTLALFSTLGLVGGAGLFDDSLRSVGGFRRRSTTQTVAGAALGSTAGAFAALAVSPWVEHTKGDLALIGTGSVVSGLGVGGLALAAPSIDNKHFRTMFSTGLTLGAASLTFLAPEIEATSADVGAWTSMLAIGSAVGSLTPAYYVPEDRDLKTRQILGGAMVGATVGGVAGVITSQLRPLSWGRVLKLSLTTLGGSTLGSGLGLLSPHIDRRGLAALTQAGAVAGFAGGLLFDHSDHDHSDQGSRKESSFDGTKYAHLALGISAGSTLGLALPSLWRRSSDDIPNEEIAGGLMVGAAAGILGSRIVSKIAPEITAEAEELWLSFLASSSLGGGTYLWLKDDDRRTAAWTAVGLSLSTVTLAHIAAPYTEYSDYDWFFVPNLALQGAATGLLLGGAQSNRSSSTLGGGALAGLGAGAIAGGVLAQFTEYTGNDHLETWGWAALGAGLGAGIAGSTKNANGSTVAGAASLTMLGTLGAGLALAPLTDYSESDLWLGATSGVFGAWAGTFGSRQLAARGAPFQEHGYPALAASSFAVASAMTATQFLETSDSTALHASILGASGIAMAEGITLIRPGKRRETGIGGLALGAGLFTFGASLEALEPYRNLTDEDYGLIATTAVLGTWHGTVTPPVTGLHRARHYGGGALVGAGLGATVGLLISPWVELDGVQQFELLAASALGAAAGGGIGLNRGTGYQSQALALQLGGIASVVAVAPWLGQIDIDKASPLITSGALLGAWHGGFGASIVETNASETARVGGGMLAGAGIGALSGLALSQFADFSWDDVAEMSVWWGSGTAIGAGLGLMTHQGSKATLALTQAGGALFGATGLALSRYTSYSGSDAALTAALTSVGLTQGLLTRGYFESGRTLDGGGAGGGALLGTGVGLAAGLGLSQVLDLDGYDIAEVLTWTAAGSAVGLGLAEVTDQRGPGYFGLIQGFGLAATATGLATSQLTEFGGSDRLLTMHGAMLGGLLGGFAPVLWNGKDITNAGGQAYAGLLAGVGVGAVAAGIGSQFSDHTSGDVGEMMLASSLASVAGAGVGLVASTDDRVWVATMQGFGLAGAVATGIFAPDTEYDASDALLGSIAGLYGAYQGLGLAWLADATNREAAGAMMAGTAVGALAGMYLSPYVKLDATEVLMLSAGSAWGSWLGVWTAAVIAQKSTPKQGVLKLGVGSTAVLTDVALVATSLAVSKLVDLEPLRFAWISVGGGTGMLLGLSAAGIAGPENMSVQEGILYGTAAGLVGGVLLTQFVDLPGMGMVAPPSPPQPDGSDKHVQALKQPKGALALLPKIDQWMPSMQVVPPEDGNAPPGSERYLFTVSGTFH